jgi:hypothetical protein
MNGNSFTAEEQQIIADIQTLYDMLLMIRQAYPSHSVISKIESLYTRTLKKHGDLVQAWSQAPQKRV